MYDAAGRLGQFIDQQVYTYMLPGTQAPGGTHKHGIYEQGGGDFLAPGQDIIENLSGKNVDYNNADGNEKQCSRKVCVKIFQDVHKLVFHRPSHSLLKN